MESSKGGGEVRRLNIVYFLSRNGRVEHPHLIRVHHLHRNGVRLRDVKRWLSELRGKEMPESFAWSYKRRYKTGYVWQDLMDDDLITPISDNEYVLKGSEFSDAPTFQSFNEQSCGDGKKPKAVEEEEEEEEGEGTKKVAPEKTAADTLQIEPDDDGVSPKPPPCLDQDSPPGQPQGSDASDEPIRRAALFKLDLSRELEKEKEKKGEERQGASPAMACHSINHSNRSKNNKNNYSSRASHVIRNILTCGQVETNDSALRTIVRRNGGDGSQSCHQGDKSNNSRKGRSTSGAKTRPGEKAVPAAYKPAAAPNCSQCGKAFKPEKLHSHMKSCKALRVRGRSMDSERMPLRTESLREDFSTESDQGFLLTH
ncbi:uncharacterized protein LOC103708106 [Phoenix dactylifera]|uniref:Uncharacterized protein LOC103708106 n=1 Tax=Phoenix dactylifera TaxID=42345 RepID=A0A8B8J3Y1_PHODC|nr:uncharacterized protein LOC103708106 [Phoenix dactylifera]